MLNKSTISLFDWKTFIIIVVIMLVGLTTIFSATYTSTPDNVTPLYIKQIGWIFIGLFFLLIGIPLIIRLLQDMRIISTHYHSYY